jgi:hypothetical protein
MYHVYGILVAAAISWSWLSSAFLLMWIPSHLLSYPGRPGWMGSCAAAESDGRRVRSTWKAPPYPQFSAYVDAGEQRVLSPLRHSSSCAVLWLHRFRLICVRVCRLICPHVAGPAPCLRVGSIRRANVNASRSLS